jgi:hypothetical protein
MEEVTVADGVADQRRLPSRMEWRTIGRDVCPVWRMIVRSSAPARAAAARP